LAVAWGAKVGGEARGRKYEQAVGKDCGEFDQHTWVGAPSEESAN
jgi:hypothetical protein